MPGKMDSDRPARKPFPRGELQERLEATRDALGAGLGFGQRASGEWVGTCPWCSADEAELNTTGFNCQCVVMELADAAALVGDGSHPWPLALPKTPGAPEPSPLPLDALPPALRAHAASVANAVQVASDMTALLGLCAVSAAVAGKVEVRVDDAWQRESVSLYGVVVAPPGERKSAAYREMISPIRDWESDAVARVAPLRRTAREQADVAERRLKRRKDEAARGAATADAVLAEARAYENALRAVPVLPTLLASDSTPEALVEQMAEQGGRIAVMSPEGGPFRILDGRYSDGIARLEELAQAYDGEELRTRRVGRATKPVRRPALTLAVALQPSVLSSIRNGRSLRGQGIYGRISWVVPESLVGRRVDSSEAPAINEDAKDQYTKVLRALLEWQPAQTEDDGTLVPHPLTLSKEATAVKREYHYRVEAAMGEGGTLAGMCDYANKSVGRAVRLAVLLDVFARATKGQPLDAPLSGWAMDGGVRISEALTTHAVAVYAEMEVDGRTADLAYVMARLRLLPEGTTETELRAATRGRASIDGAEDLAELLDELEERGCVRRLEQPSEGRGRPPSPVIEIHPFLRESTTHAHTENTGKHPRKPEEADSRHFRYAYAEDGAGRADPVTAILADAP